MGLLGQVNLVVFGDQLYLDIKVGGQVRRNLDRIATHINMDHWVHGPVVIGLSDGQTIEQLSPALEDGFERAKQQGLAESARAGQREKAARILQEPQDVSGLVYIRAAVLDQLLERLNAEGQGFHCQVPPAVRSIRGRTGSY